MLLQFSHFSLFSKVKCHATATDVAQGRVAPLDKHGNDAADALARKGAASHALPAHVVRTTMHRFAVTQSVQQMMVDIMLARAACQPVVECSTSSSSSSCATAGSCSSSTESSESSDADLDTEGHVETSAETQVSLHSGSNHPT